MTREDLVEGIVAKLKRKAQKAYYGDAQAEIHRVRGTNIHPSGRAALGRTLTSVKHYGRKPSVTTRITKSERPISSGEWSRKKKKYLSKANDIMVLHRVQRGKKIKKAKAEY